MNSFIAISNAPRIRRLSRIGALQQPVSDHIGPWRPAGLFRWVPAEHFAFGVGRFLPPPVRSRLPTSGNGTGSDCLTGRASARWLSQ